MSWHWHGDAELFYTKAQRMNEDTASDCTLVKVFHRPLSSQKAVRWMNRKGAADLNVERIDAQNHMQYWNREHFCWCSKA